MCLFTIVILEKIFWFQLRLVARDGGSPSKSATATVDINVQRNLLPPVFDPSGVYNVTIIEQTAVGEEILVVSATDNDPVVSQINFVNFQQILKLIKWFRLYVIVLTLD